MAINPLQAPINYAGMVPQVNIAQQFAEFGQVLADRQKRVQAEKLKEEYKTDLEAAIANPTQETWSKMIAKYPQHREAFAEVRKGYGEVAVRNESNMGMEVSMALENNNPEVATQKLMKIISALENSGRPTGVYQQALNQLELGDIKGAQAGVNLGLAFLDPDNFKKVVDARTAALKAPSEVTEAAGKAAKSAAEGKVATGTVDAEILKRKADAEKAFSDAAIKLAEADNAQAKAKAQADYETAKAKKEQADADVAANTVEARTAEAKAKPDPGFAIIPEAERIKLNLPPGVYQRNLGTKKIEPVSKELVRIDMGQQRDTFALKELDIPRAQEFSAAAASARSLARDSKIIANLLKGKGGGTVIKLRSDLAKTFGIESDTVTANDLANSLAIRGATQLRPPGSGSTSDTEFQAFVSAFPSLANSENGRELMAKYADVFAIRSAKIADHARKLIREDKYSEEEIARFDTSLGPILKDDFYSSTGSDTVKVGDMTYTRPANFTDKQWSDYKQSVGAK
jgi:hypothetical protein